MEFFVNDKGEGNFSSTARGIGESSVGGEGERGKKHHARKSKNIQGEIRS